MWPTSCRTLASLPCQKAPRIGGSSVEGANVERGQILEPCVRPRRLNERVKVLPIPVVLERTAHATVLRVVGDWLALFLGDAAERFCRSTPARVPMTSRARQDHAGKA